MTIQDQIFLYCSLIYEKEDSDILSCLPAERAEIIKRELPKFQRYPKEVRLTMVLRLLGYLVQYARNRHLELIHPSWLAGGLKQHHPEVIAAILSHFAPDFRAQVAALLSFKYEAHMDRVDDMPVELRRLVFQIFTNQFASMAAPLEEPILGLETLYLLKTEDLLALSRHIGVREMARAFSLAGPDVYAAALTRFPPDLQEDFLAGLQLAPGEPPEKRKTATKRLSKYDLASMPLEEATLRVGMGKLGSVMKSNPEVARRIAQRLEIQLGKLLIDAEQDLQPSDDEDREIISTIQDLIERGKIDKSSVEMYFPTFSAMER